MARLTSSLLLLWALLLGPALCMGGALEHACDCGTDFQCQHEEACADDPCSSFTRPEDHSLKAGLELAAAALPLDIVAWDAAFDSARRSALSPPPPPPDRTNLPYAQSDRPLLI